MTSDGSILWLVAEDSNDEFFLLQRACSELSPAPKLRRANNGVEAQKYLAGERPFGDRSAYPLPALVVSDLNMPLMNGLELLDWFKAQAWKPTISFVLLTSSKDQNDIDQAQERGADEYLVKPGRFGDLEETVAGIWERHCVGAGADPDPSPAE